ncbi:MAG: hypothetical protein EOO12_08405 [Chitinophagaceae bacterium]|nr:MAG: hypothetical protein EOO12_08405 [Chitinophagaceae bacterium]
MELLSSLNRRPLHNGEVITLYTRTLEIVPATGLPAAVLTARNVLNSLVQDMSGTHVSQGGSLLTQQAQELEAARDEQFSALVFLCRAYSRHKDAGKCQSADELLACIGKFGNITEFTSQPDADESADVTSLLRDIRESSTLSAHADAIGATDFLDELGRLSTGFEAASLARTGERSTEAGQPSLDDLRPLADRAFNTLCRKINSFADTEEGAEPWPGIIARLNTLIHETRTLLKARKGRAASEPATGA